MPFKLSWVPRFRLEPEGQNLIQPVGTRALEAETEKRLGCLHTTDAPLS